MYFEIRQAKLERQFSRRYLLQSRIQLSRRLKALGGIFLQTFQNKRFDMRRHAWNNFTRPLRDLANLLQGERDRRVAIERRRTRNHFIKQKAERVDIRARAHRFELNLFRGHVRGRAGDRAGHLHVAL